MSARVVSLIRTVWRALPALLFCGLIGLAPEARAATILGVHDWNAPFSYNWTNEYGTVNLGIPSSGGNTGGWLRVTFPASGDPGDAYDVIQTPASSLFSGTWGTNMFTQFDFWASNAVPSHVQVWWASSSNIWASSDLLLTGGTGTWSTIIGPEFIYSNWTPDTPGLSESTYLADLASINWIGIYIWRGAADDQIYGLDNFSLMVPEPGELIVLVVALAAAMLFLRRRRHALMRE